MPVAASLESTFTRARRWVGAALLALALAAPVAQAEQLAVRTFTVVDGLVGDWVNALLQDSRGYLWVGTCTGLSRFDGSVFASYSTPEGLPHPNVTTLLEDHTGAVWVGTVGGLVRLRESRDGAGKLFDAFELPGVRSVNALVEDHRHDLWAAAGDRLFRLDRRDGGERFVVEEAPVPWGSEGVRAVSSLAEGPDGDLWVGTPVALMRRRAGGQWVSYLIGSPSDRPGAPPWVDAVAVDRTGTVWLAGRGVIAFRPEAGAAAGAGGNLRHVEATAADRSYRLPDAAGTAVAWGAAAGVPQGNWGELHVGRDGTVWAPNTGGLLAFSAGRLSLFGSANGLAEDATTRALEDSDGNLWVGSINRGLTRVDRSGFTSFGPADGLLPGGVTAVMPDGSGGVYLIGTPACNAVHHVVGGHVETVRWRLPASVTNPGWGTNQVTLCDSRGEWWVPTGNGLFRFPAVPRFADLATRDPMARYGVRDGMGGEEAFRLFEDSRGDLWLGVFGAGVVRWERSTGSFHRLGAAAGKTGWAASAFAEDRTGAVWVGMYHGGLARCRSDACDRFPPDDDVPASFVAALFADHAGRLWVGTLQGGLLRTDDPAAQRPTWRHYTTANGLASDGILTITEDRYGRIYVGTRRGIDRLDPSSGRTAHFDTSSGLINNNLVAACADQNGDLWFATGGGASRLRPTLVAPTAPPRVSILEVRSGGLELPVPELGDAQVGPWRLPVGADSLEVVYAGINFAPGQQLLYQYSLGGGKEWSEPAAERRLHLAGLAPGSYHLRLRALRSDSVTSEVATVTFSIPPPIWRRWWFLGGVVALLAGGVLIAYRARVRRHAELERVRSRIASDLHDELGLSLSRIAILSEVARRKVGAGEVGSELEDIGTTARDLVAASSDMAWSLDPRRDDLPSLLARLRRLAEDVLAGAGVRWSFVAPRTVERLPLGAEQRRHVYLILKEAVHNAARHARASHVRLAITLEGGWLRAELSDDGCGFDAAAVDGSDGGAVGHGLVSMARRANEIGGTVTVRSRPGEGTTVRLEVPLGS